MSATELRSRLEERGCEVVFVIDRSEWMRGGDRGTVLWDGARGCCLGLAALVEGADPDMIKGKGCTVPSDVSGYCSEGYEEAWTIAGQFDSQPADDAMAANDDPGLDDPTRERLIADTFRYARGWRVEFEGVDP